MAQAWEKEKIWVPDWKQTHDNLYHFITGLKNSPPFISLSFTTTTSTLLFLGVCRTRVIRELSIMVLLSISSHGSMDWAPARCLEGHGFDSCWGLRFFLCLPFVSCWLFHPYHFIAELKNSPSFISLSFTTTTSRLLFLAVCRMRVIHELSLMASLSMSSHGSVDRATTRCLVGHGFDSWWGLRFFLCPVLVSCRLFHLYQFVLFSRKSVKWERSFLERHSILEVGFMFTLYCTEFQVSSSCHIYVLYQFGQ